MGRARRAAGIALALAGLAAARPAPAQVVRIVDEGGVVHYTNRPCDPRYARLDPGLCPRAAAGPAAGAAASPSDAASPTVLVREIASAAARHGVDPRLVEAVIQVESGGNPRAVSPKGALGVMQLMPARAAALGVADALDLRANLEGGVRHLRDLLARFPGNLRVALAAYNAGEEAVRLHGGVPPYPETQAYVRRVLARYVPTAAPASPPGSRDRRADP